MFSTVILKSAPIATLHRWQISLDGHKSRQPQVLILPGRVDKIGRPSTLFFAADFHSLENFKFSRDPQYIAYSWHTNFPGVILATRNSVKERVYVKTDRRVFSYS